VRLVNTLSGRGSGGPQAHPVAPRAQYLRRSDPPASGFAGFARIGRAAGWLAVVAILGFLLVWAMLEPAPAAADSPTGTVQSDVVQLIASARGADRLTAIPESPELDAIAATRSSQIVADFSHHLIPVPGASVWGEVIAWDNWTPRLAGADAVAMFLGSAGHRRILLGRWTAYGVGVTFAGGRWYVVGIFASWPRS
jgi:uncharacterized protein YkwD